MTKLHKNKEYYSNTKKTTKLVGKEINKGLKTLNKVDRRIITFFGSHRVSKKSIHYKSARSLAYELGKKGFAILSGGGPGIMHAANVGAKKAKTKSIGFQARLLTNERIEDPIFTHRGSFHFMFVRRFLMAIKSEALIFFPGGYGTLNELFEYAVLMQTGIVDRVPIICVNKKYWKGLFTWLKNNPQKESLFIDNKNDLGLISFVDNLEEILKIIEHQQP